MVEIKTLAWIAGLELLKEIRPQLPVGTEESDFSIDLEGQEIYGEVWLPRVLPNEWLVKSPDVSIALADQRREEPKRLRALRGKGNSQLPPEVTGIWVAHVYHVPLLQSWIKFFAQDMASRSNVLGVALWVRPGSNRLSPLCVRCRGLAGEGHEIYWLDNGSCKHVYLQRNLLCSFLD